MLGNGRLETGVIEEPEIITTMSKWTTQVNNSVLQIVNEEWMITEFYCFADDDDGDRERGADGMGMHTHHHNGGK